MTVSADLDAVRIQVTDHERSLGALEPDSFEAARTAMLADGMVVLDDLIPVAILEPLGERMAADLPALVASHEGRGNRFAGQLQQQPPLDREFLCAEVLANPVVLKLCRSLLGEAIGATFYTANTNMPGSVRQAVHCDLPQLWPDLDPVHFPPYGLVCNIPLIDTTEGNATELWPGTHIDGRTYTRDEFHRDIPEAWLEERRRVRPPVQVTQRRGSAMLRDVRLWHTGVANTSGNARPMVGVGYAPYWYNGFSIPIADAAAEALTEFGVPPIVQLDGTRAFAQQLAGAVRAPV